MDYNTFPGFHQSNTLPYTTYLGFSRTLNEVNGYVCEKSNENERGLNSLKLRIVR